MSFSIFLLVWTNAQVQCSSIALFLTQIFVNVVALYSQQFTTSNNLHCLVGCTVESKVLERKKIDYKLCVTLLNL